jgi:hypothetical protein
VLWISFAIVASVLSVAFALWQLRRRGMHRWIVPYLSQSARRWRVGPREEIHLLLCIADHFEPRWGGASDELAISRVQNWVEQYPELFDRFKDSDGQPPRHTFFYPIEQYDQRQVDLLSELCRAGFGELEVHLHHDDDTAENLRKTLLKYKHLLAQRHGLLSFHRATGEIAYGFVHGNWALDNSRPDGRWCGVDNELDVLREAGCYADFTFPSAPSPTQPRTINSIYYAKHHHDRGIRMGDGPIQDALMLIQGPLLIGRKPGRFAFRPYIENACIQHNHPPTLARLDLWMKARIGVAQRPDWLFVKLHTHGATEANQQVLLGQAMVRFREDLAQRAAANPNFHFHYVTAREMYNLARAAESGWTGAVTDARDFDLRSNLQRSAQPACVVA